MPTHVPPAAVITLVGNWGPTCTPPPAILDLRAVAPAYQVRPLTTIKWKIGLPGETPVKFSINPDAMDPPGKDKNVAGYGYGVGADYKRYATVQNAPRPKDWSFTGVIRSQDEYDFFQYWNDVEGLVWISDHMGRTFEVLITDTQIAERKPTKGVRWRQRYTVKTTLLRQVT